MVGVCGTTKCKEGFKLNQSISQHVESAILRVTQNNEMLIELSELDQDFSGVTTDSFEIISTLAYNYPRLSRRVRHDLIFDIGRISGISSIINHDHQFKLQVAQLEEIPQIWGNVGE